MNNDEIRSAVADRRKERGLTQAEVGSRARVARELISRFENDNQDIGLRRLLRICDALGLELIVRAGSGRPVLEDLDELFRDDEDR
jgi:transcriptional regulator with XRE-family HTH domain